MRKIVTLTAVMLAVSVTAAHADRRGCDRAMAQNDRLVRSLDRRLNDYYECVHARPGGGDCHRTFSEIAQLQSDFETINDKIKDVCRGRR